MKIRINEYELMSPKLDNDVDAFIFSDVHSNIDSLKKIKYIISENNTYIFIVGDLLDHVDSIEKGEILKELKILSQNFLVIITLGNHDTVRFGNKIFGRMEIPTNDLSFFDCLKRETDCIVMDREFCTKVIENNIRVSSINLPFDWYYNGEGKKEFYEFILSHECFINRDAFNILLLHSPNAIIDNNYIDNSIDLIKNSDIIFSGHNHGGLTPNFIQKISKNNIGLVGPFVRIAQPNAFGYWTTDDTSLILSNGITKVPESSQLSFISRYVNRCYVPDVEYVHFMSGNSHQLQLIRSQIKQY